MTTVVTNREIPSPPGEAPRVCGEQRAEAELDRQQRRGVQPQAQAQPRGGGDLEEDRQLGGGHQADLDGHACDGGRGQPAAAAVADEYQPGAGRPVEQQAPHVGEQQADPDAEQDADPGGEITVPQREEGERGEQRGEQLPGQPAGEGKRHGRSISAGHRKGKHP
ncbi:hypothetical protein [Kitasatospora sp. NPDC058218]|uniref:hypothetical protein n=1 Tax=Kitasatospora sp. NPDC058218 TaxID=3346385 RepID=UPI0036DD8D7E